MPSNEKQSPSLQSPVRSAPVEIAALFGVKQRAASALCQYWVEEGFFVVANASNKARRYRLADALEKAFYK